MPPKKSLGQNFLMHASTGERIADAAGLTPDSTVLEIGPGTGMLTKALLARAKKVIAVEADHELIAPLRETFAEEIQQGRFELVEGDVRSFDTNTIKGAYSLVANIPYYITGEILRQFLTAEHQPTDITVLVQKEVAVRIAREKKESLLSLSVKVYGTPSYVFTVPRGAFRPAPNVDSAVLRIANISRDRFIRGSEARFFEIIRAGFAHKRKQLANNLELVSTPEKIASVFSELQLSPKIRSEELSLEQWLTLSSVL